MFCLDFVNACCTEIQVTSSSFGWVENYSTVIHQLGAIYSQSYAKKSDEQMNSTGKLPQNILENPSTSVKEYFSWIQKIHKVMLTWKTKLGSDGDANYDEIHVYTQKQRYIYGIAQHVSATNLVISAMNLAALKDSFLEKFEQLNILLLKYVQGDSKLGW